MSRDFLNDEILAQTTLQHHGIMGQKWGVRRFQNKDGSLTDEGRKRYGSSISNDEVYGKGFKFKRVSLAPIENVKNVRKYVNADASDQKWKKLFTDVYGKEEGRRVFEHTYEAMKDVKVASMLSAKKIFEQMVKDPDFEMAVARQVHSHEKATGYKIEGPYADRFFKSLGTIGDASNLYFAETMKQGYDAVSDVYGRLSGSSTAIILTNPDKSVRIVRSEQIY